MIKNRDNKYPIFLKFVLLTIISPIHFSDELHTEQWVELVIDDKIWEKLMQYPSFEKININIVYLRFLITNLYIIK